MFRGHVRAGAVAVGAIAVLAGCSSSGGGVSQSSLETKLTKEPQIQTLISQGGKTASVTNQLVNCIAAALDKDANPSDLKKYVDGTLKLDDVGARAKGSTNDLKSEAATCAQRVIRRAASSTPAG